MKPPPPVPEAAPLIGSKKMPYPVRITIVAVHATLVRCADPMYAGIDIVGTAWSPFVNGDLP